MKKKVSLFTEWAWLNRVIDKPQKLTAFAHVIFDKLQEKYPHTKASKKNAILEIEKDIWDCLRVLSYGGRTSKSISKERVELLNQISHEFFVQEPIIQDEAA